MPDRFPPQARHRHGHRAHEVRGAGGRGGGAGPDSSPLEKTYVVLSGAIEVQAGGETVRNLEVERPGTYQSSEVIVIASNQ